MAESALRLIKSGGVARVVLARPEKHNAFDEHAIAELTGLLGGLATDADARVVILEAEGKSFCAGADLDWMRRTASYSRERNVADAWALGRLMGALDGLPKPTIAKVQGPAYGGGVGLVACCDIAVASSTAVFSLSEVKLGLIPAVISPYVIAAIGVRAARRYFLTAERFDAADALRLGLVHRVVAADELEAATGAIVAALSQGGPNAIAECKALIRRVASSPVDERLVSETVERIATVRATEEAGEGVAAFLEKREPRWRS